MTIWKLPRTSSWRRGLTVAIVTLTLVVLVAISSLGTLYAGAAILAAAFLTSVIMLGPDRTGMACVGIAFFTAPMYKGLGPTNSPVTPTDAALAVGFALLLPRLLNARASLPLVFSTSSAVVILTGLLAAVTSGAAGSDLLTLGLLCSTLIVLPVVMSRLDPADGVIDRLAWAYIAGQFASWVIGMGTAGFGGGRAEGLTIHPNYFGEAGLMSFALTLHLIHRSRNRVLVYAAMLMSVSTVYLSGSRAAAATVAGIIVLIPIIERSALGWYFLSVGIAGAGAVALIALPSAGPNSALGRLTGQGTAAGSNNERTHGLIDGLNRLSQHPIIGQGFQNLFDVHNNYLEAAIAIGIFGFIGYIAILVTFMLPLIGQHPMRRICYVIVASAAFGATIPSLYDRTAWVPASLCAVIAINRVRKSPNTDAVDSRRAADDTKAIGVLA